MNETSIKKEIILNGSESIAVFKQDGISLQNGRN